MSIAARYSGSAGPLVVRVVLSENHPVAMERSHLQISPNGATKSESCDREKNRWLVCVESCNGEDVCHARGTLFSALSIRGVCSKRVKVHMRIDIEICDSIYYIAADEQVYGDTNLSLGGAVNRLYSQAQKAMVLSSINVVATSANHKVSGKRMM